MGWCMASKPPTSSWRGQYRRVTSQDACEESGYRRSRHRAPPTWTSVPCSERPGTADEGLTADVDGAPDDGRASRNDAGGPPPVWERPLKDGWRGRSVGVVAVEAGVPDGDLDLGPDQAVGAVLTAGRLLGEDRVGLSQQVQLSLGVRVVPDGEAVAGTGRQVPGGHVDRPDRQAPDRVARSGDLHDPHRVPVGRDSRGELVTDGQGVVPFALVDRPDDTWYRLHLDTDDDLYEVCLLY